MANSNINLGRLYTGYDPDEEGLISVTGLDLLDKKYDVGNGTYIRTYSNNSDTRVPLELYIQENPMTRYFLRDDSKSHNYLPNTPKYTIVRTNLYTPPTAGYMSDVPGNDLNGGFNNGLNNLLVAGVAAPRLGFEVLKNAGKLALKLSESLLPSGWSNAAIANGMVSSELAPTISGLGYAADAALIGPTLYNNIQEGNYADAALDAALLYTPGRQMLSNAKNNIVNGYENLRQRARNAAYYFKEPFGYNGPTARNEIITGIKSFFDPKWKFDYTLQPNWYSGLYNFDPLFAVFRDLAWRKAMKIPDKPGVPQIYKPNGDGTFSYDLDIIDSIKKEFAKVFPEYTDKKLHPGMLYNNLISGKIPPKKVVTTTDYNDSKLRELLPNTPIAGYDHITGNGGFGTWEKLPNGDVLFTDLWDLQPFKDVDTRGLPIPIIPSFLKSLQPYVNKKLKNFEAVSFMGGNPFIVKTTIPAVPKALGGNLLAKGGYTSNEDRKKTFIGSLHWSLNDKKRYLVLDAYNLGIIDDPTITWEELRKTHPEYTPNVGYTTISPSELDIPIDPIDYTTYKSVKEGLTNNETYNPKNPLSLVTLDNGLLITPNDLKELGLYRKELSPDGNPNFILPDAEVVGKTKSKDKELKENLESYYKNLPTPQILFPNNQNLPIIGMAAGDNNGYANGVVNGDISNNAYNIRTGNSVNNNSNVELPPYTIPSREVEPFEMSPGDIDIDTSWRDRLAAMELLPLPLGAFSTVDNMGNMFSTDDSAAYLLDLLLGKLNPYIKQLQEMNNLFGLSNAGEQSPTQLYKPMDAALYLDLLQSSRAINPNPDYLNYFIT